VRDTAPPGCCPITHHPSLARGTGTNHPRSREPVPSAEGWSAVEPSRPWSHDDLDDDGTARHPSPGRSCRHDCSAHHLRRLHGTGMGGAVLLVPRLLVPRRLPREPRRASLPHTGHALGRGRLSARTGTARRLDPGSAGRLRLADRGPGVSGHRSRLGTRATRAGRADPGPRGLRGAPPARRLRAPRRRHPRHRRPPERDHRPLAPSDDGPCPPALGRLDDRQLLPGRRARLRASRPSRPGVAPPLPEPPRARAHG
jgi:hypothetical protein